MAINSDVYGLSPIKYYVPPGATAALLVEAIPNQNGGILRWLSGSSLEIVGVTVGTTLSLAQLNAISGSTATYLMATSEAVNINGSPRFYLMNAGGATTVVQYLRSLSAGA